MEENMSTLQAAEQATTESGGAQPGTGGAENLNAFQKWINDLFGGKKEKAESGSESGGAKEQEKSETEQKEVTGESYTKDDLDAAIEEAKKKWQEEAAEQERLKKLSPEEAATEEQQKKDSRIAQLEQQLLEKELKESAARKLEADGYPVGLAEVLDYTSQKSMETSMEKLLNAFKTGLETAVQAKLRGRTPEGLGGAGSAQNMLADQIAKNIRGL